MKRPLPAARIPVLAGILLALAPAVVPAATAEDDSAVTWSVQPADETGADGRAWAELELDPGAQQDEYLAVGNFSDQQVTFRLSAADGFFTERGRFNMLDSDSASVDAGTWIDLADEITVAAGATAVVPYTVTVPADAEPGDHAAGIAASVLTRAAGDGAAMVVESRVGFRVMTRVTGDLLPAAAVTVVSTDYRMSWNPFSPGSLTVSFDVANEGNARLRVSGVASAGGQEASFPGEQDTQELLSGDSRRFSVELDDVWPLIAVPLTVSVAPEVVVVAGDAPTLAGIAAGATVWALPWAQLIALAAVVGIVWAMVRSRVRSRRRIESLVAEARAAGLRDAHAQAEGVR